MPTEDDRCDEELFAAYLGGEEAAFRMIVERWTPTLRATMRRGGIAPGDIDDLVQDVFLHLHRSAADFRAGAPLRPWIVTIALNTRRDYNRRPLRRVETVDVPDLADDAVPPPLAVERQQAAARVRSALDRLPESQRRVVELHWMSEVPFRDVARAVGASVGAVRVRAHRGYERLRASLKGEEG